MGAIQTNRLARSGMVELMPDSSFFSLPRIDKQNIPWMTLLLVAANVAVFIWIEINGSAADSDFMLSMGAAYAPSILIDHEYYRLFTHMFLHFGFLHLFNNMISLIILGYTTEHVLGRVRFLLLYLLSGIGGGLLSLAYCVSIHENNVSAGASGAMRRILPSSSPRRSSARLTFIPPAGRIGSRV